MGAILVCAGALGAQDIDVQYPAGTGLNNGNTVDLGGGNSHSITVRVENVGMADLNFTAGYVDGNGFDNVSVNFSSPSAPITLTTNQTLNISITIDPDKDSDWSFNLRIASDDPVDGLFILKFEGTRGDPKDDDDDCSTGAGSGFSWLMLLGLLSAGIVATRMRLSRE